MIKFNKNTTKKVCLVVWMVIITFFVVYANISIINLANTVDKYLNP